MTDEKYADFPPKHPVAAIAAIERNAGATEHCSGQRGSEGGDLENPMSAR